MFEPPPEWVTPDQMEWYVRHRIDAELSTALAQENNAFRDRLKRMPRNVRQRWNEKESD